MKYAASQRESQFEWFFQKPDDTIMTMSLHWKRFFLLYMIQFVQLLDFMAIAPGGAILVKAGYITAQTISYALTLYALAAILGSFLIQKFKNTESTRFLAWLLMFFSLSQIIPSIQMNDATFLIARLIGGVSGGVMASLVFSKLKHIGHEGDAGLWNGRIQTVQSVIGILGIPISILMISNFGSSFFYLSLAGVAGFAAVVFFKTNIFEESPSQAQAIRLSLKGNADLVLSGFFSYFAAFLLIINLPNYLINSGAVQPAQLSLAYTVSGILTVLLGGKIGALNRIHKAAKLMMITLVLIMVIQLLFFKVSPMITLFVMLPVYLLLSTARMIYQRGIILEKKNQSSAELHLLNNVVVRCGILAAGLINGWIYVGQALEHEMNVLNYASIGASVILLKTLKCIRVKQ